MRKTIQIYSCDYCHSDMENIKKRKGTNLLKPVILSGGILCSDVSFRIPASINKNPDTLYFCNVSCFRDFLINMER